MNKKLERHSVESSTKAQRFTYEHWNHIKIH